MLGQDDGRLGVADLASGRRRPPAAARALPARARSGRAAASDLGPMEPPGQAERLAQGRRRAGRACRSRCTPRCGRPGSTAAARPGRPGRPCRGRGRRRACRRTARRGTPSRGPRGPGRGLRGTSGRWPSQVRGQGLEGLADLARSAGCGGPGSARGGRRRRGRRPAGGGSSRWARPRRRLLGLGLGVLDVAVLADVAAEHPDGLLADPGVARP